MNLALYRGFNPADDMSFGNAMMWAAHDIDEDTLSPDEKFFLGTASCLEGSFDKWDFNIVRDSVNALFKNKKEIDTRSVITSQ